MAAQLRPAGKGPMTDINITPFVDIILVVLIAFMVTSTVVATKQVPIELPSAATAESGQSTSLAIAITREGALYLDGAVSEEGAVRTAIRQARARGDDVACLIGADAEVAHGDVMGIVDLVRQEGVTKFGIEVTPIPVPDAADRPSP
jgi:biopolymer transport protein TolR